MSFPRYPSSNRVPGVFADIDPSKANTATAQLRALIIAQMAGGTAVAGTPVVVPSVSAAITLFGAGSQAAIAVQHYRNIDTFGELWVLPLADDDAAQAAAGSIGITGTTSASGTLVLLFDNVSVSIPYAAGDTAATILGRIPSAMAKVTGIPLSAGAVADGALPLTAINKGLCGNDILIGISDQSSDYVSAGLAVTITQPTGGTQNPTTLATALLALGSKPYDFIACPYTDAASLGALKAFLSTASGRWSWNEMIFGHVYSAIRGTLGTVTTFAQSVNDEHLTVMPIADSPSSPLRWAAEIAASAAVKCRADPALPITQMALTIAPPSDGNVWSFSEQNSLLYEGMSVFSVSDDGTVSILRLITTYQENVAGSPDDSYLDVETMNTLAYVIRDLRTFQQPYLAMKLVSDTTRIPGGSGCINAPVVKQALIGRYRFLETAGYVQNSANFAAAIIVQNKGAGQLAESLPIDVANQVRTIPMLIQFRKS
ncbi:hypothetical protein A0U89_06985 [Kozakia baliensis]|uniref:Tail sheath protein subtilisin-like domain-containing protein n=1 Tax=Kozakia baliensis TaxID=153496 RepID=A0A1D8UWW8_9PROT|nr:hypothetical protein A0U89_06985 [Kozakia baliensis]